MKQYLDLLQDVLDNGTVKKDRTGVGTISVSGRMLKFKMSDGFPLITTKKVPLRLPLEEMFFFIRGSNNNNQLLEKNITIWSEWSNPETGDLGRLYGVQFRDWTSFIGLSFDDFEKKYGKDVLGEVLEHEKPLSLNEYERINPWHITWSTRMIYFEKKVDQIKKVQWQLKNEPHSRRIIVNAWNPGELELMALPPCHYMHQLIVNDNKLSMIVNIRSNDLGLGNPFNVAQYAALLHMYAVVSGYEPDELTVFIGDAHIYLNHVDQLKLQLTREPKPLPKLWINPNVKQLEDFTIDDFKLEGYDPHPHIKMEVAV